MSKRQRTKWTIMVYLAGDNDLTSHCVSVLQQLEAVEYRDDVCVLACFESSTPWPRGSRYLEINCSHRPPESKREVFFDWELHNDLIPPFDRDEAEDVKSETLDENGSMYRPVVAEGLRRFINWSVTEHDDSERFMLILFGHGPIVAGQSFLVSENPGSFLRLEDLRDVLNDKFGPDHERTLDIVAFQNCVMNGIETAYEIRNHADYVIGSQGLVLATGWPYEKMIEAVVERPSAGTDTIARKMLKACARTMLDFTIMDRSSEQSACNLERLRGRGTLTTAVRSLGKALKSGLHVEVDCNEGQGKEKRVATYPEICDAVRMARLEAQSYWWEMFVDLYDFCERLVQNCNELVQRQDRLLVRFKVDKDERAKLANDCLVEQTKTIVSCCIDVMDKIKDLVPSSHSYYIGSELQYSHGLSIYFPWSKPVGPFFPRPTRNRKQYRLDNAFYTYSQYGFVKETEWDQFLEAFFKATLRNMRRANRRFEMKKHLNNLEAGLAFARYGNAGQLPLPESDLQKSSPDTARADFDMSFNIKNYPRRRYLSPADEQRKIDEASAIQAEEGLFQHQTAPPVSGLGWNIPTLVAEVIKPTSPRKRRTTKVAAGSAKNVLAKLPRTSDPDRGTGNQFERTAAQKSSRKGQTKRAQGNPLAKVASPRTT